MDFSFLGHELSNALKLCRVRDIYEIRIRNGFNILVNYRGQTLYLNESGLTLEKKDSFVVDSELIDLILENLTEHSIYAFNEQLKLGFLTTYDGVRVGICGDCVLKDNNVTTIKNVTSLNVRIPHNIEGCSKNIINKIIFNDGQVFNTLIISPAGFGKTTLLKDVALSINATTNKSILIIDERGEFGCIKGQNIDKVRFSNKLFAFSYALRSMSPQIVITDELMTESDWQCTIDAKNCGLTIIASCHAKSLDEVKAKTFYKDGVFNRFVVLEGKEKAGVILGVYNENGELV